MIVGLHANIPGLILEIAESVAINFTWLAQLKKVCVRCLNCFQMQHLKRAAVRTGTSSFLSATISDAMSRVLDPLVQ